MDYDNIPIMWMWCVSERVLVVCKPAPLSTHLVLELAARQVPAGRADQEGQLAEVMDPVGRWKASLRPYWISRSVPSSLRKRKRRTRTGRGTGRI